MAVLVRALGDIDLAEDAVQDAFAAASERWPSTGLPPSPAGWIITTARNRAIDRLRRESSGADRHAQAALLHFRHQPQDEGPVQDDRLRLIFTLCSAGTAVRHSFAQAAGNAPETHRGVCHLANRKARRGADHRGNYPSTFLEGRVAPFPLAPWGDCRGPYGDARVRCVPRSSELPGWDGQRGRSPRYLPLPQGSGTRGAEYRSATKGGPRIPACERLPIGYEPSLPRRAWPITQNG